MSREPSAIKTPMPELTWLDRAAWLYSTGGGIGLCPKAPGTAGSLLGPAVVFLWQQIDLPSGGELSAPYPHWISVAAGVAAVLLGVAAASRTARRANCEDPGFIVCDEIAAFMIVFAFSNVTWLTAAIGFAWFRLFDIWKPWPIRRLERLPSGWGIMADDLAAGLFAAGCLQGTLMLFSLRP